MLPFPRPFPPHLLSRSSPLGFRTDADFRALDRRLLTCGALDARRGGRALPGEAPRDDAAARGGNWVAVVYVTALGVARAWCLDGGAKGVGGETVVFGVRLRGGRGATSWR